MVKCKVRSRAFFVLLTPALHESIKQIASPATPKNKQHTKGRFSKMKQILYYNNKLLRTL